MSARFVRPGSVDGLERRTEEHLRLLVACGPAAFTIDALPGDLEELVNQHDGFGAPAARAQHSMLVEHVMSCQASLHEQLVGSYVEKP